MGGGACGCVCMQVHVHMCEVINKHTDKYITVLKSLCYVTCRYVSYVHVHVAGQGGREEERERGREGEREGRKGGQGGTKGVKSSLFCFLNINTHMYGEYDTTYKNASDSLTGPPERMCTR